MDVLVVGSGPAALATALALRSRRLTVSVAGRARHEGGGGRHEVLPGATRSIISALGVASGELEACVAPLARVEAWWGVRQVSSSGTMDRYQGSFVVDRRSLDRVLLARAIAAGTGYIASSATGIEGRDGKYVVHLDRHAEVECRFLVDASGRRRRLARPLGSRAIIASRLTAVSFRLTDRAGLNQSGLAVIEAAKNGWWFVLPTGGNRCLAQFFTSPAAARLARSPEQLPEILADWPDSAPLGRPHRVQSASTILADPVAGPRWLAVGDAALAMDPVSSSGLTMALKSGLRAGHAVADALGGDQTSLPFYAAMVGDYFKRFVLDRRRLYAMETRFPGSDFWASQAVYDGLSGKQRLDHSSHSYVPGARQGTAETGGE